ncbi:PAS domain-containing sensor histidine kinase [Nitriliruptoraceae bacterium ZYF776]|nr:PAS domain-containing sensor histidine kinase [Profundirhabdus halotolerans]
MLDAQTLLDHLPEAVVVVGPDGSVVASNDRAEVLLGIGTGAVGAHLDDVLDVRDDAGVRCHLAAVEPKLGERLAERVLKVQLRDRQRAVAFAGRRHDGQLVLTARSAGRREKLDAVRGDVVATVSHEIRSPLTSVKGFTRTLLSKWDRFSDEQKRAMLETVDADADRVTRLLTDLLDVSRIDAGRVQLHRTPLDLGWLVGSVVDKARHRDVGEGRDLVVDVPDEVPKVRADADKVEQVLTNLVENALRYAPGSQVVVSVRPVDGERVHLAVRDHGPGIPADQHRQVFQKFGRGRGTRRAGTGLGLYITRGLVEAHGGHVRLEPPADGGTCVVVDLPVDPS